MHTVPATLTQFKHSKLSPQNCKIPNRFIQIHIEKRRKILTKSWVHTSTLIARGPGYCSSFRFDLGNKGSREKVPFDGALGFVGALWGFTGTLSSIPCKPQLRVQRVVSGIGFRVLRFRRLRLLRGYLRYHGYPNKEG